MLKKARILPEPEDIETLPTDAELLVFSGFTSGELNQFISLLHKRGVKIPLKCVETAQNKKWSLRKLYDELSKEHEQLNKG
ncbi:MAG: DUF3783 domain-containing protein [Oribacterium sp.]|nr:DUF3783 domain-containing protein [Oribacterium sp.]